MLLVGPNKIIEEINSSGWINYSETIKNEITLKELQDPDIIKGTIEYLEEEYNIILNELESNYNNIKHFNYKLVYIPKEGYITIILLYINYNIIEFNNNKISFRVNIRNQDSYNSNEVKINLILSDSAIKILLNKNNL